MYKKIISIAILLLAVIAMPTFVFADTEEAETEAAAPVVTEEAAATNDEDEICVEPAEEAVLEAEGEVLPEEEPALEEAESLQQEEAATPEEENSEESQAVESGDRPDEIQEEPLGEDEEILVDMSVEEEQDFDGPAPVQKQEYAVAAEMLRKDPYADLTGLKIKVEELDEFFYYLACEGLVPEGIGEWSYFTNDDGTICFFFIGPVPIADGDTEEEAAPEEADPVAENCLSAGEAPKENVAVPAAVTFDVPTVTVHLDPPAAAPAEESPLEGLIGMLLGLMAAACRILFL